MSVREDGSEALVSVVRLRGGMGTPARYVRLKGLHPGAGYRIRLRGEAWEKEMHLTGSLLMEAGIPIWDGLREYDALWMHVERED